MNFYKGKMISKDYALQRLDSNDYGKKTSELKCYYTVTTDADTYTVFFIDQLKNTEKLDNIGIYMIQIIKESERKKYFDWGGDKTRCAGIFIPSDTNVVN